MNAMQDGYVKVDVEGFEFEVLKGMEQSLRRRQVEAYRHSGLGLGTIARNGNVRAGKAEKGRLSR